MDGDGAVSILDLSVMADRFNAVEGSSGYDLLYDIDLDGSITILDIATAATVIGRTCFKTGENTGEGIYTYNGDGLRTSRTIGATTTTFAWGNATGLPVILRDSAGNRYLYGLDLISVSDSANATFYYHTDGLGSTTALTNSTGAVLNTYQYDVYGALRAQTGTQPSEFTFTGEQVDTSGLEYLRARYYDPTLGRFLGRDPVPYANRYAYVGNNPANYADPAGLWCPGCGKVKKAASHAADWLSEPDNVVFIVQTGAGLTMTATCGPQALWAPDAAVCGVATMVYAGAVFYQATQLRTFAGGACVVATSAPALLPGPVGIAGKVLDFAFDFGGAMCVPGTAGSAAARSALSDKEGPIW